MVPGSAVGEAGLRGSGENVAQGWGGEWEGKGEGSGEKVLCLLSATWQLNVTGASGYSCSDVKLVRLIKRSCACETIGASSLRV